MAEYHLECPYNCSFREGTKWSSLVSDRLVAGISYRKIAAEVKDSSGDVLVPMTIGRHKKHIVVSGGATEPETGNKATNIEILETIIQKGFGNSKNWKPTISDTMKAMDMWFRLTQGNPFDELLDTLASASLGDENPATEGAPVGVEANIEEEDSDGDHD